VVTSQQDGRPQTTNKYSTLNTSTAGRQPLTHSKNISNIARILLNANTSKSKQNQEFNRNNTFAQNNNNTPLAVSQSASLKNKIGAPIIQKKNEELTHIIANHQLKPEPKTSAQLPNRDSCDSQLRQRVIQSSLER
jgi:hypothetical protein